MVGNQRWIISPVSQTHEFPLRFAQSTNNGGDSVETGAEETSVASGFTSLLGSYGMIVKTF